MRGSFCSVNLLGLYKGGYPLKDDLPAEIQIRDCHSNRLPAIGGQHHVRALSSIYQVFLSDANQFDPFTFFQVPAVQFLRGVVPVFVDAQVGDCIPLAVRVDGAGGRVCHQPRLMVRPLEPPTLEV